METGATVPGYSGVAASPPASLARIRIYCSRGSLTPVAAPNASPNDFLGRGRRPDSNQRFRIRRLKDVAWGPIVQAGASDPSYSGGVAACIVVSYPDFL